MLTSIRAARTFVLLLTLSQLYVEAQVAQAVPVMHLSFDQTSGASVAIDATGNGRNGTLVTMDVNTAWVPGKIGNALSFRGATAPSTDYVEVLDHSSLDFGGNDFTVAFWVYKRTNTTASSGNNAHFWGVNKWNTGSSPSSNEWSFAVGDGNGPFPNNTPRFVMRDSLGTTYILNGTTDLTLNQWDHVAIVREGTDLRMYVNGAMETVDSTLGSAIMNNVAGRNLRIANSATNCCYTNAIFDDLGIWQEALANGEVSALVNLANNTTLNYDLSQAQELFTLHNVGSGSVTIDGLTWYATDGLSLGEGGLSFNGADYFLQIGGSGTGLTTFVPPVPEPTTGGMLALGGWGIIAAARRRKQSLGAVT